MNFNLTLSQEQHQTLEAIHGFARSHGVWPTFGRLVADTWKAHKINLAKALSEMPAGIIANELHQDWSLVRLRLPGLLLCKGNTHLADAFLHLHRLAAERFIADPYARPEITKVDLQNTLASSPSVELGLFGEVLREAFVCGSSHTTPDNIWHQQVDEAILPYATVSTLDEWMRLYNRPTRSLDSLEPSHIELLSNIYEHWRTRGEWPRYLEFLIAQRTRGDVLSLLREIPKPLLWTLEQVSDNSDRRLSITLSFEGMIASGAADDELVDLLNVVRLSVTHFLDHAHEAPLAGKDIIDRLALGDSAFARLGPILHQARVGVQVDFRSLPWSATVSSGILKYESVGTLGDFLHKRFGFDKIRWATDAIRIPKASHPFGAVVDSPPISAATSALVPSFPHLESAASIQEDTLLTGISKDRQGHPLIGPYPIARQLGKGGVGNVYLGWHPAFDREVAIKVVRSDHSANKTQLVRFKNEALIADRLAKNNIVRVYDTGSFGHLAFLVMELIKGHTANELLQERQTKGSKALEELEALEIVLAASRGLLAAHEEGIIHRDIKPHNILVPKKRLDAKLADFGIAKHDSDDPDLTVQGQGMGTRGFTPLEQWDDAQAVGPTADVFAMGATLYCLLVGVPPFDQAPELCLKQMRNKGPHPIPQSLAADIRAILEKCLQKDPALRYPSALFLLRDLERLLGARVGMDANGLPAHNIRVSHSESTSTDLPGVSADILGEHVLDLLSDPAGTIKLDRLVNQTLRRACTTLQMSEFAVQGKVVDPHNFVNRLRRYQDVMKECLTIGILLGRWAERTHHVLIEKLLCRLAETASENTGIVVLINFAWFPIHMLLYGLGVAAVSARRFDNLAIILSTKVHQRLRLHRPSEDHVAIPAGSAMSKYFDCFKWLPSRERQYVPVSEFLFEELQPSLDGLLVLGKGYEKAFDRFEVLYSLVYADLDSTGPNHFWGPVGRFAWKHHSMTHAKPLNEIIDEGKREGSKWGPVQAGLFGGSIQRFLEVSAGIRNLISRLPW